MDSEWKDNPARYRELSRPHESIEAANEATRGLFGAIEELRVKHRIPDLILICGVNTMRDGEETGAVVCGRWGDDSKHEAMLARELGRVQGERQQMISRMMRGGALMEPR